MLSGHILPRGYLEVWQFMQYLSWQGSTGGLSLDGGRPICVTKHGESSSSIRDYANDYYRQLN
ncbi:MAG: hypothetical protein ABI557_08705, partial [Aureliella sp.]